LRYLPNGAEALGNEMAVSSKMHLIMTLAVVFFLIDPVLGQDLVPNANDVQQGHALAISLCGICHVAAPDQPYKPKMKPSVPSCFDYSKKKFDAQSLTGFLVTTHRGLDNPRGMPNLNLTDVQIKQIVAYFLSLQSQPRVNRGRTVGIRFAGALGGTQTA
jgi:mono/diheme cytochrome c family protein